MKKVKKSSQSQSHDFDLTWLYDLRNKSGAIVPGLNAKNGYFFEKFTFSTLKFDHISHLILGLWPQQKRSKIQKKYFLVDILRCTPYKSARNKILWFIQGLPVNLI